MKDHADLSRFWDLDEQAIVASSEALADLLVATDILAAHVRPRAIKSVVRRESPLLDRRSLRDLVIAGRYGSVREAVQRMADLGRVQP